MTKNVDEESIGDWWRFSLILGQILVILSAKPSPKNMFCHQNLLSPASMWSWWSSFDIKLNRGCKHDQVWENDEKSFHFFVFQICSFTLWCLYMIIHVCSSSRRKIKGNEYKLRTIRTLSCPVSCIFMNKPKQKYNQATNKMEKDEINWIALLQLWSCDFKNWIKNRIRSCKCQNDYSAA